MGEINSNKKLCEECNKKFRHVEKCKDGKNRCKKCKKNEVTNRWYNPLTHKEDKISRYSMSDSEKIILHNNGKSWKEINGDCKFMKNLKQRRQIERVYKQMESKQEETKKLNMQKNLVAGLR